LHIPFGGNGLRLRQCHSTIVENLQAPIYGYIRTVFNEEFGQLELRETTLSFAATDLSRLACLLAYFADEIESGCWRSSHAHLTIFDREWKRDYPNIDVIIANPGPEPPDRLKSVARLIHQQRETEPSVMTPSRIGLPTARMQVARAGVGLATVFGLLGQLITFYPGAEVGWFGIAAAMALARLLSPTRQLRLVAVVLAVLLAGFAWGGYVRGRQYREWLSQQPKLLGSPSQQAP
jgi:hypothetical protein